MNIKKVILLLFLFTVIAMEASASQPWYIDALIPNLAPAQAFGLIQNANSGKKGNLSVPVNPYNQQGSSNVVNPTQNNIYNNQPVNSSKVEYVDPNNDTSYCRYALEKTNAHKNIPKIAPKLPYVTIGAIKVAKKDIQYKPVAEPPYKLNYWAGARNACLANGMRLPTPEELSQLYNNRHILGTSFEKKEYWTAEERSACYVTVLNFQGVKVHRSIKVNVEHAYIPENQKIKQELRVPITEHFEINEVGFNKGKLKTANVRCVR